MEQGHIWHPSFTFSEGWSRELANSWQPVYDPWDARYKGGPFWDALSLLTRSSEEKRSISVYRRIKKDNLTFKNTAGWTKTKESRWCFILKSENLWSLMERFKSNGGEHVNQAYDPNMDEPPVYQEASFSNGEQRAVRPSVVSAFGHDTLDRVPHIDFYRNPGSVSGNRAVRPSLQDIHDRFQKVSARVSSPIVSSRLGMFHLLQIICSHFLFQIFVLHLCKTYLTPVSLAEWTQLWDSVTSVLLLSFSPFTQVQGKTPQKETKHFTVV